MRGAHWGGGHPRKEHRTWPESLAWSGKGNPPTTLYTTPLHPGRVWWGKAQRPLCSPACRPASSTGETQWRGGAWKADSGPIASKAVWLFLSFKIRGVLKKFFWEIASCYSFWGNAEACSPWGQRQFRLHARPWAWPVEALPKCSLKERMRICLIVKGYFHFLERHRLNFDINE